MKACVEPDSHAVGKDVVAIGRLDERPATGRDDGMARGEEGEQDLPLDLAEIGFAVLGEHLRNRPPFPPLDLLVEVDDAPAEPTPERTRHGRLARPHESHEVDLVGRGGGHFLSASSTSKNPG
jgi:hypothetical protein